MGKFWKAYSKTEARFKIYIDVGSELGKTYAYHFWNPREYCLWRCLESPAVQCMEGSQSKFFNPPKKLQKKWMTNTDTKTFSKNN